MSSKKCNKMTIEDLESAIDVLRKELHDAAFDVRIGKDKDYSQMKYKRRELARALTIKITKRRTSKSTVVKKEKNVEEEPVPKKQVQKEANEKKIKNDKKINKKVKK